MLLTFVVLYVADICGCTTLLNVAFGFTAGPLGQGIANAVGLAAVEAHLCGRFNKDDSKIVDHYT